MGLVALRHTRSWLPGQESNLEFPALDGGFVTTGPQSPSHVIFTVFDIAFAVLNVPHYSTWFL